jgi:hypothetical protein
MPNGNPAPGPLNSRYFRPVRGKETPAPAGGTYSSNPLPSSGESTANCDGPGCLDSFRGE